MLAADLEIEVDPYVPGAVGDAVMRVIRVFNNGDEAAVDAVVRSAVTSQLDDATWTRESGFARQVHLPASDRNKADLVIIANERFSFSWQVLGDVNGDALLDFGISFPRFRQRQWVVFGGQREVTIRTDGPPISEPEPPPGEHAWLEIVRLDNGAPRTFGILGDVNADGIDDFSVSGFEPYVLGSHELGGVASVAELTDEQSQLNLPDAFQERTPVVLGDVNNDGFVDYGLDQLREWGISPYIIVLGGPHFDGPEDSSRWFELPLPIGGYSVGGVAGRHAGDVNGDGIDDILISMEGWDCFDCTQTDRSFYEVDAGAYVVFGHEEIGRDISRDLANAVFLPVRTATTPPYLSKDRLDTITQDRNQDGIMDLILLTGDETYVVLGGPNLQSHDLREMQYEQFNGQNGYVQTRHGEEVFVDVDGDGALDRVDLISDWPRANRLEVRYGSDIPPPSDNTNQGDGDIDEIVDIPAGESLIYTVTGKLKSLEVPDLVATAALAGSSEPTGDNVYPRDHRAVWVVADLQAGLSEGDGENLQQVNIDIVLTNRGPHDAKDVQLGETISAQLGDASWTVQGTPFPSSSSDSGLFGPRAVGTDLDPGNWVLSEILGQEVGNLGDVNGDGFPELFATSSAGLRIFWGGDHHVANGSLVGDLGDTTIPLGLGRRIGASIQPFRQNATVTPLGDVNADGFDDFLTVDETREGTQAAIYLGAVDQHLRTVRLNLRRRWVLDLFGDDIRQLSVAGDVNGDGFTDYFAEYGLMLGTERGIVEHASPELTLLGDKVFIKGALFPLGDINGDGISDLGVQRERDGEAVFSVVFGGPEIEAGSLDVEDHVDQTLTGATILESCPGCGIRDGYDVNGDGVNELVLLSGQAERPPERVYVITDLTDSEMQLGDLDESKGFSIDVSRDIWFDPPLTLSFLDFDGDGRDEMVLPWKQSVLIVDADQLAASLALAELRNSSAVSVEFESRGLNELAGRTLAPAFDANGDGLDDLFVGTKPGLEFWISEASLDGEAFLILGRPPLSRAGSGTLGTQTVDIPAGGTVTIRIEGSLVTSAAIDGEVTVVTSDDQQGLVVPPRETIQLRGYANASDINRNDAVDFADFLILSANFGAADATVEDGDIDGNGVIDVADFLLLSANFGQHLDP